MKLLIPEDYELLCYFSIPGNLPRKSNNRRIVTNKKTNKPMIIKSKPSMAYLKQFAKHLPKELKDVSFEGDLLLVANIYYSSWRPDLSDELLCDLLQDNGVVRNDRQFMEKFLSRLKDAENPRVEAWIYQIPKHTPITIGVYNDQLVL